MRIPGSDLQGRDLFLEPAAAVAWLALVEHAAKNGVLLTATYAHRDHDQQERLRRRLGRMAARPGESSHEVGTAVDIDGTRRGRGMRAKRTWLYHWLAAEAPKFGFVNTIRKEPWHWEHRPRRADLVAFDIVLDQSRAVVYRSCIAEITQ